jgi:hypothetical protein
VGDTWGAVRRGESGEVQRLVGQDPQLLHVRPHPGYTLLTAASCGGRTGTVRCLVDLGAALNEQKDGGGTALYVASYYGRTPVVRLLTERGANPSTYNAARRTPLTEAPGGGFCGSSDSDKCEETVRCLLDHPTAAASHRQPPRPVGQDGSAVRLFNWSCTCGEGAAPEGGRPRHR